MVIGGTGVLCGAMAQGLAQAGATVVVAGRDAEKGATRVKEIEAARRQGGLRAGRRDETGVDRGAAPETIATQGRVDMLINGAGVNNAERLLRRQG